MKLCEFNRIVNPNDEACYIIKTSTDTIDKAKFDDIKPILKERNDVSLGMYIPKGLIVIEMTDSCVARTIKARNEQLMVAQKGDKYYIFGLSSFDKNTTNNILACGANANTLVNTKKGTEILLPFRSPKNVLQKYEGVKIIHSNGIGPLPLWLTPLRRGSSKIKSGFDYPIRENIALVLNTHVLNLASFTKENQTEILKFINSNLTNCPLDEMAINNLCASVADAFTYQFMNKNEFLHDKFGDFVIRERNIKKDKKSKKLYFYNEKEQIYVSDQDCLKGYITKLCPRLKQYQKDEALNYIQDYLETDLVEFNSEPFNVVFKNGILHLDTMEFESMSPDHLESIKINVNYNPDAYSKTADEFFNNITCGDELTKTLLYESIGYAMLKTVDMHKAFMMTGSGRNGKSTFIELVTAILGEQNCAALSLKDMTNNFRVSSLVGKLASLAADISSQPITESDLLKSVSAGDRIMLEKKYEQAYEDRVFATLFFACNKLPRTPDTSDGFYRRWVIIPFNADLTKIKNVEGLLFKKKLLSQESLDYIAYKAINAIFNVLNNTMEFTQPESVVTMLKHYKTSNSSVLSWFKEEFVYNKSNPTEEERTQGINRLSDMLLGNAYKNYTDWCQETNKQKLARPSFEEEVKKQFNVSWEAN